jgi:hypothetical protein
MDSEAATLGVVDRPGRDTERSRRSAGLKGSVLKASLSGVSVGDLSGEEQFEQTTDGCEEQSTARY